MKLSEMEITESEDINQYRGHIPPDMALIASDGQHMIIIDRIGPALDYWFSEVMDDPDHCLENPGPGIWLWEGGIDTWQSYEGDFDSELEGKFSVLSPEQWELLKMNGTVWDEDLWYK